jgi:leucyl-tRNA synthetase
MRDLGLVTFNEPVKRLFPQGMVHRDGEVMSKSKGNTVAPDTIVGRYGADTLRLYILNVAPPEDPLEWNDENIAGVHRFLYRVWRLLDRHAPAIASEIRTPMPADPGEAARALRRKVHQTIQRVSADVEERFKFNTAVSALIELEHAVVEAEPALAQGPSRPVFREALETLVLLLSPFAPHVCEETWMRLGRRFPLVDRNWPVGDASAAREQAVELAVQVNGKLRGRITVAPDTAEDEIRRRALAGAAGPGEPRGPRDREGGRRARAAGEPGGAGERRRARPGPGAAACPRRLGVRLRAAWGMASPSTLDPADRRAAVPRPDGQGGARPEDQRVRHRGAGERVASPSPSGADDAVVDGELVSYNVVPVGFAKRPTSASPARRCRRHATRWS